jgi:mono/diheme cytochrome c family protein
MYKAYCAACHGKTGEGNGPAASALKIPPANLTTLAERHGGKFPMNYVRRVLEFGVPYAAHGSHEMPIWGSLFHSLPGNSRAQVQIRISNLIRYLETLQKKKGKGKKQK